jgi:hypothetical protein
LINNPENSWGVNKMKTKNILIIIALLVTIIYSIGLKDKDTKHQNQNVLVTDSKKLDANTISTWFRNNCSFNRDPSTGNAGFIWPKGTTKTARYASGLWLGAIVGNDTLVAICEYEYEYLPGYTDASGNPQGKDDPNYRVYKLQYQINDNDRLQWPNALLGNSNQGAPIYFDMISNSWKPLDFADQTMFYSYTDSYPESHKNRNGSSAPLKADIKQINWSFDEPGAIGNIAYSQYMIINRNNQVWNNAYFTIWTDDDVGEASDDLVACDTNFQMGYTYNGDNDDNIYGLNPPAVSFNLIKGPAIYTGNNNDTAFICNGKNKKIKAGYKQQGISVFNWYYNSGINYGDPRNNRESYRMMKGLQRDGSVIINPITNQLTTFMYSGDPVTNTGWVVGPMSPNDQRFMLSTGPVNMNPGDTQIIVLAQVIARGTSNLNSITVLRQYAQIAKDNYNNCFANVPIAVENNSNIIKEFRLYQNYPNPFNPSTVISYSVGIPSGQLAVSSYTKLTVYDLLGREVAILVNAQLKPGSYEVEWDGSNFASGVYYYKLTVRQDGTSAEDFVESRKMILLK